MNYGDLPESLKDRVEVVVAREEREFQRAKEKLPSVQVTWPGAQPRYSKPEDKVRDLLIKRAKTETLFFAHEVNVAGKDGHVKARDIPGLVDWFLNSRCIKLSRELPPTRPGSEDRSYKLSRDVQRSLDGSPEWDARLTERLEVAETQAASSARGIDSLADWKHRDAWTVREFAQLCCGWNPSENRIPDQNAYNEAVDRINRAVRVNRLQVSELNWPSTGAERLYESVPMFRPSEVVGWAKEMFPDTFPFDSNEWRDTRLEAKERNLGTPVRAEAESELAHAVGADDPVDPTAQPDAASNVFRRGPDGLWDIEYGGERKVGLRHLKGFELIKTLLADPRSLIGVEDLMGERAVSKGVAAIDDATRRACEASNRELQSQYDEALARGDSAQVEKVNDQMLELEEEMQKTIGVGGRTRLIGDHRKRLRNRALRQYTTALKNLRKDLPQLEAHLKKLVRRPGCSYIYEPDPDLCWQTSQTSSPSSTVAAS